MKKTNIPLRYGRAMVCSLFLLALLPMLPASSQLMQRIKGGIEDVARGMDYLGRRTGELLGSGLPLNAEKLSAYAAQRTLEQQYPCGPSPVTALSNEFGAVRVNSWDESLIKITANLSVHADTQELSDQLLHLMDLRITHGDDYLECRTVFPTIKASGQETFSVDYTVFVPRKASVIVDNLFGDVQLANIGGMVVADVRYGSLELRQLQQMARVHVQGEFPVQVQGLASGGVFRLQGAAADFQDVHGPVEVNQFRGTSSFRNLGENVSLSLMSDSGQARIVLAPEANPDLSAVITHGEFNSALDVTRTLRGAQLAARHPNMDALQRISVDAVFSQIDVVIEGNEQLDSANQVSSTQAYNDAVRKTLEISSETALVVHAAIGNITIEGVDEATASIEANRVVWAPSAAAGMDALDALEVGIAQENGQATINTRALQDMQVFGCTAWRIDLRIQCPREMALRLQAEEGAVAISGMGGGVSLELGKGDVSMEHIKGETAVVNRNGAVKVVACSGPMDISAQHGSVTAEEIYGKIRIIAEDGPTYVDNPRGDVEVRQKNGDVRVLSLESLPGNVDIFAEDGSISLFLAPETDAAISAKATQGRIQSSLPLSGTLNRDVQEFFGRVNVGAYSIRLETVRGDILLN